jgi:hypothetical protein
MLNSMIDVMDSKASFYSLFYYSNIPVSQRQLFTGQYLGQMHYFYIGAHAAELALNVH